MGMIYIPDCVLERECHSKTRVGPLFSQVNFASALAYPRFEC